MKKIVSIVFLIVFLLSGCSSANSPAHDIPASIEDTPTPTPIELKDIEVTLTVDPLISSEGYVSFEIRTNLPDDTSLLLTLSNDGFTAQDKVIIINNNAVTETFSNKGSALNGSFTLSVTMGIPSVQSEAVRAIIGENGEALKGSLVQKDFLDDSNIIKTEFLFDFGQMHGDPVIYEHGNLSMLINSEYDVVYEDSSMIIKLDDMASIRIFAGNNITGLEEIMLNLQHNQFVGVFEKRDLEDTGSDTIAGHDAIFTSFHTSHNAGGFLYVMIVSFADDDFCYTIIFHNRYDADNASLKISEFMEIVLSMTPID